MLYPSKKDFLALTKKGNLIPIYKELLGDLETPVSAYYKIAKDAPYSFLLESVEGEEKVARYSFLAKDPDILLKAKGNAMEIIHIKNGNKKVESKTIHDTPLTFVRDILRQYKFVSSPHLPRFCGGFVGYLSYDTVRYFERLPQKTTDDLKLPDMVLMLSKSLVIFDHINHNLKIVQCVEVDPKSSPQKKLAAYAEAEKLIDRVIEQLNEPLAGAKNKHRLNTQEPLKLKVASNFTKPQFEKIVLKAKEEIKAGEIIQVVLSQRFNLDIKAEAVDIYRVLRKINPSPYMYLLNLEDFKIVGSSPELLVRCEEGIVETRPIAGTRRRGKNEAEDAFLAKDLLSDPKEKAEHIMLVDLGRNDIGRVCEKGSVHISEFMAIEKYSHVMHIISNVRGRLSHNKDIFDVLKAAFPAGTVSGAPKIRAMEIIEDLENLNRGPYAGCIGYFSFSGNLDSCITIRTIVVKDNKAYIQAGAGIVADSDPKKEYQETLNKAKAQIMAIQLAHENY